ncbi:zinc finger protein 652-A-like [Pogonomyrmex barbatus]|uniref:Zinc finger protein 652-A-like n=1 Tax=Pogonomyrmex barbatus TaxID=144034 RepID=A0A6I9WUC0_9HYME|nr:zinc finger protein 652-A-like [Pogonomyrmex barbatus]XP_011643403.1 zinc finger protein 652-A-like [Pogonomyrmex barbatus]
MELSTEILESLVIDNKDIVEVLKSGNVKEENIIFESEVTEDSEETEIEEIIEIIEEVEEENDEVSVDNDSLQDKNGSTDAKDIETVERIEKNDKTIKKNIELYSFDEENSIFASPEKGSTKSVKNNTQKTINKQVINYDVDEDWQDEELERIDELDSNSALEDNTNSLQTKKNVNNQTLQSNRLDLKVHVEFTERDKSRIDDDINNKINNIEDDAESTQEIVKNTENNLLYTVLGTKKQDSSIKQQEKRDVNINDAQFVKMERLEANTIPVEGTIYYEGDNMETLYVAQAVDDNEQYQYDNATMEQEEQISWETANIESNQNQEESSQDQIFLHEDDDGQLYFKDANGTLQPVYLTEDGNYAIAESNDDDVNKELQSKSHENNDPIEEDYILPDLDSKAISNKQTTNTVSSPQDFENEDNTVTISLIISEDENGQKRTQVIIPTTDNSKCDICNKSFKSPFQLLRHNRLKHAREEDITTRNFPCDLCPKRYPDQASLARHRKTHTGDRPFQCLECQKNFPTSTALRRHLTQHNSQSQPLPCIYCGRRFMDKTSLTKHEESHMPIDQRKYTCDICQKTFNHMTDLSMHKKHHDPDKKFDCEVCGREFNRLNNLQRHMLVHQQQQGASEEILSCDVCGITYKFMSSLTRHMVTTHMNPEKMRQQAEEQRRKRENNYRKYLENRKMYETQHCGTKRKYNLLTENNDETA